MQNRYDGVLQFHGQWRAYQQRVLEHAQQYLQDRKVHIVAAPGSGKTTLGIELIRRLGEPCLILSPSITIRQQWLERITSGFLLPGNNPGELLSNDIRQIRPITAITYQALYSAMKQEQGELRDDDGEEGAEEDAEQVDFRGFDIFSAVKAAGVRTICLDEAHHLRSEWWRALESFLKGLGEITTIALTATPPYDSTPGQWKRYIDLCGPIDEEIFTPELVAEGSLCPHEDYVYFNWPTKSELEEVERFRQTSLELQLRLLSDGAFTQMIATHRGLRDPEGYSDQFLENPPYFSALLIFCQAQNIPLAPYLRELIGQEGYLPELDSHWLEILLQGFLFDDTDSYEVTQEQRQQILKELKLADCIYRKKVTLTHTEEIQKILVKSRDKMESIGSIVEAEHRALRQKLRLLVLCDHIKKEKLPIVGTDREMTSELGAVPIFEHLRRTQDPTIRLGCLCGSVVIVPLDTKAQLETLLQDTANTLTPLGQTGYGLLQVGGKRTHVVAAITELFRQGQIHVLIGTKSLLGEGWDAPCINSLILATYVGSFMLSNQMRGRAIRIDRENPEKTGNIWHLACIFPQKSGRTRGADLSGDYETLVRRFDSFLGVSAREPVIESGIERLGIPPFDTRAETEQINQMMLQRAADRAGLQARWRGSIAEIHDRMEIAQVEEIPRQMVKTGYFFVNALGMMILNLVLSGLFYLARLWTSAISAAPLLSTFMMIGTLAALAFVGKNAVTLFRLSTPERRMQQLSQAVLAALIEIGEVDDPKHCRAEVKSSADHLLIGTWLKSGSMRDKTTFAGCMEELWSVIDNPRYLLTRESRGLRSTEYYPVPEIFGRQKERVMVFEKHVRRVLGKFQLVYTRTPVGRKVLLRARTHSFVNHNQQVLQGKKVAKGKYE